MCVFNVNPTYITYSFPLYLSFIFFLSVKSNLTHRKHPADIHLSLDSSAVFSKVDGKVFSEACSVSVLLARPINRACWL